MLGESLRERFGERPEVPIRQEAIKLLASDTRLSILKHLDRRRMTVSELARALDLNKSTVHEHLAKLVEGGLIRRDESEEREFVYYELTKTARYVLQPASARFVLLMGSTLLAGVLGLALLHLALTAGQGLALHADDPLVAAGEARLWSVDVTRPGLLGLREPAPDARLYLLSADDAAEYQFTGSLPPHARALGAREGLQVSPQGTATFRTALDPGVHYLLATAPGVPPGLFPLRAESVDVVPRAPTLLVGVDPPQMELAVRFEGEPVASGLVQALDQDGRELAQVPVLNGRAVVSLEEPAERVLFRFKPAEPGSAFALADGTLQAPAPHVAFEPALVPLLAPTEVRVVVDDPVLGPRGGATVAVVRADDGRPVAQGTTAADGSGSLQVRLAEPGELIVRAGDREVGRITAKPGLRLWVAPGPHWEGEQVRVRSLLLGAEPQSVGAASIVLDGREVGVTDPDGWLTLQFGLGGHYLAEARREGHVAGRTTIDVLPRTGYLLQPGVRVGLSGAGAGLAQDPAPAVEVQDERLLLGQATRVRALVANEDSLPRVVRAELREDGLVLEARGLQVGPYGQAWAEFDYAPAEAGAHLVQVNDLPPRTVEAYAALPGGAESQGRAVPGVPAAALPVILGGLAVALAVRRR